MIFFRFCIDSERKKANKYGSPKSLRIEGHEHSKEVKGKSSGRKKGSFLSVKVNERDLKRGKSRCAGVLKGILSQGKGGDEIINQLISQKKN